MVLEEAGESSWRACAVRGSVIDFSRWIDCNVPCLRLSLSFDATRSGSLGEMEWIRLESVMGWLPERAQLILGKTPSGEKEPFFKVLSSGCRGISPPVFRVLSSRCRGIGPRMRSARSSGIPLRGASNDKVRADTKSRPLASVCLVPSPLTISWSTKLARDGIKKLFLGLLIATHELKTPAASCSCCDVFSSVGACSLFFLREAFCGKENGL